VHSGACHPCRAVELVRPALAGGARVRAVAPAPGGNIDTQYRVDLEGGPQARLCVRLVRRDPAAGFKEAAVLRRLAGTEVPVPEVGHVAVDGPAGATVLVLSCVEGVGLDEALAVADAARARRLGASVGPALAGIGEAVRFESEGDLAGDHADPDRLVVRPWDFGPDPFLSFLPRPDVPPPRPRELGQPRPQADGRDRPDRGG